jgi:hypothetical protein
MTRQRCRDVQKWTPLSQAEPEELISAMRPCWWQGDRKLSVEIPPADDPCAGSQYMSPFDPDFERNVREERTKELRSKAEDFCAMKCTGAELIVPIFEFAHPIEMAA